MVDATPVGPEGHHEAKVIWGPKSWADLEGAVASGPGAFRRLSASQFAKLTVQVAQGGAAHDYHHKHPGNTWYVAIESSGALLVCSYHHAGFALGK